MSGAPAVLVFDHANLVRCTGASILSLSVLLCGGCANEQVTAGGARSGHRDGSIGNANRNAGNEHVVIRSGVAGADQDGLPPASDIPPDLMNIPDAVPRVEPISASGNPTSYEVFGEKYVVLNDPRGFKQRGDASWYGKKFHGKLTSSGEPYDMFKMTAAHKTLPIPCYVRVTNLGNQKSVIVRVNDRGPFHSGRIIDVSYAAAVKLGLVGGGSAPVEIEVITPGGPTAPMLTASAAAASTNTTKGTGTLSGRPVVTAQMEPIPEPLQTPSSPPNLHFPVQTPVSEPEPSLRMATTMAAPHNNYVPPSTSTATSVVAASRPSTSVATTSSQPLASNKPAAPLPVSLQSSASGSAMNAPAAAHWLQAGLFGDASNAAALREQLLHLGVDNVQLRSEVHGASYVHRVMVGPFADPVLMDIMRQRLTEVHLASIPVAD